MYIDSILHLKRNVKVGYTRKGQNPTEVFIHMPKNDMLTLPILPIDFPHRIVYNIHILYIYTHFINRSK